MRSEIGKITLDTVFRERELLNIAIVGEILTFTVIRDSSMLNSKNAVICWTAEFCILHAHRMECLLSALCDNTLLLNRCGQQLKT